MIEVSRAREWSDRLEAARHAIAVHEPGPYYDLLCRQAARVDLWVTEYQHVLDGPAAIVEWMAGTGLRPFLEALNEDLELVFANRRESERNARLLHTVMDAIRTEHQDRQAPARVLARVRKAKEMLSDLMPENLTDKQRRRLRSDLAALQAQASYLLGEGEKPREDGLIDKIYRKLRA